MRKICLFGLILLINVTIQISGQVWEGTIAVSPVGDIPEGLFAKTNAFESGSQVEITDLNSGSQVVVTIVGRIDIGNIFMLLAPQAATAIDLQGSAVTRVSAKLIGVVQAETNPMTELTQSLDQDISPAAGIPPELQDYLNRLSSEKEVVNSEPILITYPETANLNPDISTPPIPLNENTTEIFVEPPVILDVHTPTPKEEVNNLLEESEIMTTEKTDVEVKPLVLEKTDESENPLPEFPVLTTQAILNVPTDISRQSPPEDKQQFDMLHPNIEDLVKKSLITESTINAISSLTSPVVEASKPIADLSMIPNSRKMILEPAPLRPPAETSLLKETNTTITAETTTAISRPVVPGDIEALRQQQKAIEIKLSELIENERIIESHLVEKTRDLDLTTAPPSYPVTELESSNNSPEKEIVNTLIEPPEGAKGPFFLLQLGAFSNIGSAYDRISEVPSPYTAGVIASKSTSRNISPDTTENEKKIYKVVIGPLTRDESGALLYQFRTQGFPDAFLVPDNS